MGVDNSENLRTLARSNGFFGGRFEPSPSELMGLTTRPDEDSAWLATSPIIGDQRLPQLRSEIVELMRSSVEQYWVLHERTVELWAADKAVDLAERALTRAKREKPTADLFTAKQRLEQFRQELESKRSEWIPRQRTRYIFFCSPRI